MPDSDDALDALLQHLKSARGFDFTGYKRSSLERRIAKRMEALGVEGHAAYLDRLEVDPNEFDALFNTILINVTAFFRDAPTWEYLEHEVIPALLERIPEGPIRVWSAGCASGEEVYSLVMLLAEALGDAAYLDRVKVYATDVDDEALEQARAASYAPKAVEAVSEGRLQRFFESGERRHVFRKDLRRTVIFGRNDLVQDAPISRIDLLACRNTLMYFNAETQAAVLGRMNFALKDRGVMVLGKSEMLLTHGELFAPVDLKRRVFRPIHRPSLRDRLLSARREDAGEDLIGSGLRDVAFDGVGVAQLVVGADGTLAAANHEARQLLAIEPGDLGRPLKDLEVSFRPFALRTPIERVLREATAETLPTAAHTTSVGDELLLEARLTPLLGEDHVVLGVAVMVEDVTERRRIGRELEDSRNELEAAYEELQSTVEELETTNEELQSTNEELETMNEELQSTNEELETINGEVRQRSTELDEVNAFMEAILTSLHMGVVVVDRDQVVRVWNEEATDQWGLRADEVEGQRFFGLDIGLPLEELRTSIGAAIVGAEGQEVVVDATNRRGRGLRCRVRIMPLNDDTDPTGAVVLLDEVA